MNRLEWIFRMAFRDSRGKRGLLVLFMLSVVFGIGAVVAIQGIRTNLERIIENESKTLLGADLILSTRRPPGPELKTFMENLGGRQTREIRFRSMAYFPSNGNSRFVQVRAIDGPFPFHGELETDPSELTLPPEGALLEENLLLVNNLQQGDVVRIGEQTFPIAGALVRIAGDSQVTGFFAPRVYVPLDKIENSGLIRKGSIVRYRTLFAFENGLGPQLKTRLQSVESGLFVRNGVSAETVEERQASVEEILGNLFRFLSLVGFIALLLGGIGIAGAVHVFIKSKETTIAILRCLGTPVRHALGIYLTQVLAFGFLGALVGSGIGALVQLFLPKLIAGFLPFEISSSVNPGSIVHGLLFGGLITTGFALLPLMRVRKIQPLNAIRSAFVAQAPLRKDPLLWILSLLLAAGIFVFTLTETGDSLRSLIFLGGLGTSLLVLAGLGAFLRLILRQSRNSKQPYVWRLALSNLYRPNNRTILLIIILGMGVLLMNSLFLVRDALLQQLDVGNSEDAPNLILLDVQSSQKEAVLDHIAQAGFESKAALPVVTMRVESIKGKPLTEYRQMPESPVGAVCLRFVAGH